MAKLCKVDKVGISAKKMIFSRVYWLFIEFTDFLSSLPTFFVFIDFYVFFSADFYRLFSDLLTVNRKFLITDFRLLLTSVKPENFIDFYRSKKKNEKPPVLSVESPNYYCRIYAQILRQTLPM